MNIFSVDVESNGLYGIPISIATIVYSKDGVELDKFTGRIPDDFVNDKFVIEEVLPQLHSIPVNYSSEVELLKSFAIFYSKHRKTCKVLAHVPYPVETNLFKKLVESSLIGVFEAPFPLFDLASMLFIKTQNPSLEDYIHKRKLPIPNYGKPHNPLYDCAAAATVYFDLIKE